MEFITSGIDFIIHLDHHMNALVQDYGTWVYLIVFLIIFCETGLVVTPFLPGDSLLFILGALAAEGPLKAHWLIILLSIAAILGDTVNYWIGHILASKVLRHEKIKFLKSEYLERTERFYAKYGNKTIIIARFVPIIRTFAPFFAGVGTMPYTRFLIYNVVGGLLWINLFIWAGYFFGNIPAVEKNFTLVVFVIIILSILPAVIEFYKAKKNKK